MAPHAIESIPLQELQSPPGGSAARRVHWAGVSESSSCNRPARPRSLSLDILETIDTGDAGLIPRFHWTACTSNERWLQDSQDLAGESLPNEASHPCQDPGCTEPPRDEDALYCKQHAPGLVWPTVPKVPAGILSAGAAARCDRPSSLPESFLSTYVSFPPPVFSDSFEDSVDIFSIYSTRSDGAINKCSFLRKRHARYPGFRRRHSGDDVSHLNSQSDS